MADSESRVVIQFVGADGGLTATASDVNRQLSSVAAGATALKTKLSEAGNESKTYGLNLKSATAEAEKLFQTNSRLTAQRVKETLKGQADASKSLAAAEKEATTAAEKLFQVNARLTAQRVKEELKAQAQAARELAAAQKAQQAGAEKIFQTNAKLTGQKVTEELQRQKQGYLALGLAAGSVAAGLGAIGAKGVKGFAEFDKSIRTFGVVTESTGTGGLATLRGEVERLSAATTKTPQEIASVAVELGKAGFTAEKTKQALAGVVQSSEATGEGLARTGEVIGSTLNQFGLSADNSIKIADLLTQASNASAAGTNDLGEALSYVGSQAAGSNQSIDDTITTLALLANAGIKGSSAGTGLAEALRRVKLASASATTELNDLKSRGSKNAVAAFERLDQSVRDAQGNLKPFPEIIKSLKGSLGSLDQVNKELLLNALFGVQGGRVVQTLLGQTDEQINQVTGSMAKFEGASARASSELTKGLGASFTLLGSSTDLGAQKIGEFLGVGLEPLVRGATAVINTFISLPAPIQAAIVTIGVLATTLAAAVALVTAFELANGRLAVTTAVTTARTFADTIATNALAASKILAAAATGQLTAAQNSSISAFVRQAATAGLFAGAIAAIGLAVDTFQSVGRAAEAQKQGVDEFAKSFEKLNEAQLKSADSSTQKTAAASLEEASNKRIQESIGGVQRALDVLRGAIAAISLRNLLEQFAQLEAVPQPIKNLIAGIVNFLPKVSTAAEAAANNSAAAFGEVLDTADKLEGKFNDIFNKGGFKNATKEELEALSAATAASISAIEKAAPADAADAKAKELRINRLKELQKQLAATGKVEASGTPKANSKPLEDNKEEGSKLKEQQQDDKAKESAAFQERQRKENQTQQDEQAKRSLDFQEQEAAIARRQDDEKEKRAETFQATLAAIDQQNETAKEERVAAFQAAQAAIDEQNQLEAQARETAHEAAKQRAQTEFDNARTRRADAQQAAQTDAGRALSLEGARGKNRKRLQGEDRTQGAVDALDDSALLGEGGKALDAAQLAALAKKTAGLGSIRNSRDEEQAQFALKALSARQDKLLKEQERKEEEEFKAKQRLDDQKFKDDQEKIADQKAAEKKTRDQAEKLAQEKIDDQRAAEKAARVKAEKLVERKIDDQEEADKKTRTQAFEESQREAQRAFEREQNAAKAAFATEQRNKDRQNAEAVKKILESAKIPAPPAPTSVPVPVPVVPRFAGGPVVPGTIYLGGERGMEGIDFGRGRSATVGERGPQLFQVGSRGYVHTAGSAFTQRVLQTNNFATAQRSSIVVTPSTPLLQSDPAMLRELRSINAGIERMRTVNQYYQNGAEPSLDRIYEAAKMAARASRR